MKIFTIVGTRPNFVKIDPLLPQTIVHTGQHYDVKMSKVFFSGLKLPEPKYNLGCTDIGQMIDKLKAILSREKPDLVIVFGDTNSSLAGALAASTENIRIAHIEAGLRCGDRTMPEERNRIVIDKLASVLFCPNQGSATNLLKEGITKDVHIVGDPMFDSMGRFMPIKKSKNYRKYSVLTLHRAATVDKKDALESAMAGVGMTGKPFVFPVHPRTRKNIKAFAIEVPKNIKLVQPQAYKEMLSLISNAEKVVTDSGGVQREAFWMNVPVVILREQTEWTEIVGKKGGILAGPDRYSIAAAINTFEGKINAPPEPNVNGRIRSILYKYA